MLSKFIALMSLLHTTKDLLSPVYDGIVGIFSLMEKIRTCSRRSTKEEIKECEDCKGKSKLIAAQNRMIMQIKTNLDKALDRSFALTPAGGKLHFQGESYRCHFVGSKFKDHEVCSVCKEHLLASLEKEGVI